MSSNQDPYSNYGGDRYHGHYPNSDEIAMRQQGSSSSRGHHNHQQNHQGGNNYARGNSTGGRVPPPQMYNYYNNAGGAMNNSMYNRPPPPIQQQQHHRQQQPYGSASYNQFSQNTPNMLQQPPPRHPLPEWSVPPPQTSISPWGVPPPVAPVPSPIINSNNNNYYAPMYNNDLGGQPNPWNLPMNQQQQPINPSTINSAPNIKSSQPPLPPTHLSTAKSSSPPPSEAVDQKKIKTETSPPPEEDPPAGSTKKPVPIMIGKRRGQKRILPTGVVKKIRTGNTQIPTDQSTDSFGQYMAEVRKYKEQSCEEERKNRPLVK